MSKKKKNLSNPKHKKLEPTGSGLILLSLISIRLGTFIGFMEWRFCFSITGTLTGELAFVIGPRH